MTVKEKSEKVEIEPTGGNPYLLKIIRDEVHRDGTISFARFMELALYHPQYGYYLTAHRRPGRDGDFLTAPEASAYFGLTLARQVAECWERLGRPDPFDVREYGAGVGGLAYDIIAGLSEASPGAFAALRYRLVEPNRHRLDEALSAMAEVGLGHIVEAESFTGDDSEQITGVVIANEVADALPVHRLVVKNGTLLERYVVNTEEGFGEECGPLSEPVQPYPAYFARHGVQLTEGALYDVSPESAVWFATAGRGLARGYAIIIDYGYPVTELFRKHRLEGTVRGYFGHTVTDDPFIRIGEQDLTGHVDFTLLREAGETAGMTFAGFTTQAAFLASLGLGDRLVALQRDATASITDYAAAQAVVMRLIDPGGLGRFGVLLMANNAPADPPLIGLAIKPPPF